MRLLLVNPALPESFWSFRWALERVLGGKRSLNPPLGLATLAALCPPHWQVTIVDENVEALPEHEADRLLTSDEPGVIDLDTDEPTVPQLAERPVH